MLAPDSLTFFCAQDRSPQPIEWATDEAKRVASGLMLLGAVENLFSRVPGVRAADTFACPSNTEPAGHPSFAGQAYPRCTRLCLPERTSREPVEDLGGAPEVAGAR